MCLLCRLAPFHALVHPLRNTFVASLLHLLLHDALEHLASKADKVVPPQRILKLPVPTLALLPLQQLLVAKLARAHPQIAAHGEQVEANLRRLVPRHAALQHLDNLGRERVRRALAVRNGRGLQAVELVQRAVDGRVRDKVEGVLRLGPRALRLVDKRVAAREAVVHLADQVRVAEGLATELGGEHHCELAKVAHLRANVDVVRLVHQHA